MPFKVHTKINVCSEKQNQFIFFLREHWRKGWKYVKYVKQLKVIIY